MLRNAVLILGLAMLLGSALAALYSDAGLAIWLLVTGGMISAGTVFERVLYKPLSQSGPGPGWTSTGERFTDPATGKLVEVFYDPKSGERRYVETGRQ